MDGTQLRSLIRAHPFRPFRVLLRNGEMLEVAYAFNTALSPSGRLFLPLTDERAIGVETAWIARIEIVNAA